MQKDPTIPNDPTEMEAPKRGVPVWAQVIIWIALLGLLILLAAGLLKARIPSS